jgi:hypothetical protein
MGYLRVSTGAQELDKNKADILRLANQEDLGRVQFVEEKVSGKVPWRKRRIANLLETLQAKDNIIVSELSRLGRSMLESMEILSIAMQKASASMRSKATGISIRASRARSSRWRSRWRRRLSGISSRNARPKRCGSARPKG